MSNKEISKDIVALEQHNLTVKQVEELYGDGLPYDYNRLIETGRVATRNIYQSMLDLGKACMRIAAHETRGKFEEALERMGASHADGWFARQAVLKIGDVPESSPVNFLGKRKVRSVLQLDEPIIKTYLEGGDLGTIPHDDVEKMSSRQLEEEVRKLREERKQQDEEQQKKIEALEKVVRQKESKISDMEMELAGRQPPTKEDLAQAKLDELKKDLFRQVGGTIHELQQLIALVERAQQIDGVTVEQLDAWALIEQPEDFFPQVFELAEELNEMIENIRPAKPESEDEE
ncbi:hypothetical protein [Treponema socranskii]|uniref:hypothetical protein n=1 Tax=Treponema socranskii TaxID=53419 RepID=UPI003D90C802